MDDRKAKGADDDVESMAGDKRRMVLNILGMVFHLVAFLEEFLQ